MSLPTVVTVGEPVVEAAACGDLIITTPEPPLPPTNAGVFNLSDVGFLKAANTWPRGPVAPTNLVATAGNTQLALTWTAPATTYGTKYRTTAPDPPL